MKVTTTTTGGINISLSTNEAKHLQDEIGDLPQSRLTSMNSQKLLQIYRALEPILNLRESRA